MKIDGTTAVVTGGASGLGLATATRLVGLGAKVVIADLPTSAGQQVAERLGANARFIAGNVIDEAEMAVVFDAADLLGPLRILVHCAGHGGAVRILDKEGKPGSQSEFERVVRTNLFGTFNVLRQAASRMASANEDEPDRGVCVLTASIAAYEGQIGQAAYSASKGGIVGIGLPIARELARFGIRVMTIAPGIFWTPMMAGFTQEVQDALGAQVPFPSRLGKPEEYAQLVESIVTNPMLNGEVIRLDGAIRMSPK
ncbi:MAG: 3-hydroxy-2-methylbutyryl-CoA dehydrogenase [Rhizorhabdus sp.]|nr:3-hydroxy-2-methylbutyryl-CoA dehydrogenase [Rhizorhabdus sp.]